jgi:transcriptional regulator with XRE-family HTH domain
MDIQKLIKEKGFTQKEVAMKMGIEAGTLSRTINKPNPTVSTLRQIASIIGCDIMDFFKDEATHQEAPVPGNSITCPNCGCEIEFRAKQ